MKLKIPIVLLLFSPPLLAQQSFQQQHSPNGHVSENSNFKNVVSSQKDGFVGCIDYKLRYEGVETKDVEALEKIEFLIADTAENYGIKRTRCYNQSGDWVAIYSDAAHVDKVWYFADINEEYTLFQNGVLKFSINSEAEPEGFYDLGIKEIEYTDSNKSILGYKTKKIMVELESGTTTEYWISDKITRLPASYEKNKLAYTNQIMGAVQGIHLYQKKTVANLFVTIEEAVSIEFEKPSSTLFLLPDVGVYSW